jgi:hypothetical protein
MIGNQRTTFLDFLSLFPEIEFPVTLTSDSHHIFSKNNDPLPEYIVQKFLEDISGEESSEYKEYIACFRLPDHFDFYGIVFWKADLMKYEYVLTTFDKKGRLIGKQVIAGTKSNGKTILERIATLQEDGSIVVAEGENEADELYYQAGKSRTYHFELLQTGDILLLSDEKDSV